MPLPDLADDERAELVRLVHDAIAGELYFLSLPAPVGYLRNRITRSTKATTKTTMAAAVCQSMPKRRRIYRPRHREAARMRRMIPTVTIAVTQSSASQ